MSRRRSPAGRVGGVVRPGTAGAAAAAGAGAPLRPWWRHPALWSALAAIALYLPALRHGFVWDDHWLVESNPALRSGTGLARLLVSDLWSPNGSASGYWRPLVVLSYWLDGTLWRFSPAAFHATNLIVHAGAAALVAALALQSGAPALGSLAAGLWFAGMPHHVESVAWVAGRTDLLCALLVLLALLLDRGARVRGAAGPGWAATAAFALGLLSKEIAIAFLPLAAIAEWIGSGAGERRGAARGFRVGWLAPYLVVAGVWLALHVLIAHRAPDAAMLGADKLARSRMTAFTMVPRDLVFLWPLATHTPGATIELPTGVLAPEVIASAVLVVLLGVGLVRLIARRAAVALPLALFAGTLAPLPAVAALRGLPLFGERFLYLPSAGVAWALALAFGPRPWWRNAAAGAVAAGLVLAGGIVTLSLIPDWHDDLTLFASITRKAPRSALGHSSYAMLLAQQGRLQEADAEAALAIGLEPRRSEPYFTRALIHYARGEWAAVVADCDTSIALDPQRMEPQVSRARALLRLSRYDEARAALEPLLARLPGNPFVESAWGQYLVGRGDFAAALPYLERAAAMIREDPDLDYAHGLASARLQRVAEAREAFQRAVDGDPTLYDGWLRLAVACHLMGDTAARDLALQRAAVLPQAADGRVEAARRNFAAPAPRP